MSLKIDPSVRVESTPAPSTSEGVVAAHTQEQTGRTPAVVRQETARNMPAPTLQGTTARAGESSFFTRVGQWVQRHFTEAGRWNIPAQWEIPLAQGGHVTYPSASFLQNIRAVPAQERAAYIQNLPTLLAQRIDNGQKLIQSVINEPSGSVAATKENIADIMLFLDAKAWSGGKGFTHGAFSVEDPEGKILAFLNSCPDKYLRSSTHMKALQNVRLPDGQLNTHRGIDIPHGSQGLPHGMATMTFAAIPALEGRGQRVYLKMETYGCRLSNLSAVKRREGQDAFGERPIHWQTDVGNMLGHLSRLIRSRFISVPGARREDMPGRMLREHSLICTKNQQRAYISDATFQRLMAGLDQSGSRSVHGLVQNMRTAYMQAKGGERIDLAGAYRRLVENMLTHLDEPDSLDARMGNEKMFSLEDLKFPLDGAQRQPLQKYGRSAVLLNAVAEPLTTNLVTCLRDLRVAVPTDLLHASNELLTLFFHAGGGVQSMADALYMNIDLVLSRLSQEEKEQLYAKLSSPEGQLHCAASSHILGQMRFSVADGAPLAGRIGGLAYHDMLMAGLVRGLEDELHISRKDSFLNIPSETIIQKEFAASTQKQLARVSQYISSQGITEQFTLDAINRFTEFTINGTPCNDAETLLRLVPNTAVRIALTSLVGQGSAAFGQELMAQLDMAPILDGDPVLTFRYTEGQEGERATLSMNYNIPYRYLMTTSGLIELKGTVEQSSRFFLNSNAKTPRGALTGVDVGEVNISIR